MKFLIYTLLLSLFCYADETAVLLDKVKSIDGLKNEAEVKFLKDDHSNNLVSFPYFFLNSVQIDKKDYVVQKLEFISITDRKAPVIWSHGNSISRSSLETKKASKRKLGNHDKLAFHQIKDKKKAYSAFLSSDKKEAVVLTPFYPGKHSCQTCHSDYKSTDLIGALRYSFVDVKYLNEVQETREKEESPTRKKLHLPNSLENDSELVRLLKKQTKEIEKLQKEVDSQRDEHNQALSQYIRTEIERALDEAKKFPETVNNGDGSNTDSFESLHIDTLKKFIVDETAFGFGRGFRIKKEREIQLQNATYLALDVDLVSQTDRVEPVVWEFKNNINKLAIEKNEADERTLSETELRAWKQISENKQKHFLSLDNKGMESFVFAPIKATESCIKCHEKYELGEIMGAFKYTLIANPHPKAEKDQELWFKGLRP